MRAGVGGHIVTWPRGMVRFLGEIPQNRVVGDPYRTIPHVRVHTPVERREQLDLAELGAACC
jgi:hypothetical protein